MPLDHIADGVVPRWPAGEVLITGEPFAADRIGLTLTPKSRVCVRSLSVELAERVGG